MFLLVVGLIKYLYVNGLGCLAIITTGNTYETVNPQNLRLINSWNHSGPHPWSRLHYEQALLWTLRNSSWISRLIKLLTTKQSNTSITQTRGGHSWLMVSSDMMAESMSWKLETWGLEYYNTSTTTSSWDISVKTKPLHQSDTNIHGLDFRTLSPSFVSPVPSVCILNHSTTCPMACSNNYRYQNNPGIQYQWTS